MKLPAPGQDVYVLSPTGAVNARVAELAKSGLVLTLPQAGADPVDLLLDQELSMQFTNRRGVCRVEGVAHRTKLPHAIRFEPQGKARIVQRREYVRVDAVVPASYKPFAPDAWTTESPTLNVSGGGFLLAEPQGLPLGHTTDFKLDLGDGQGPLAVLGTVVRQTDGGAVGIRIVDIDPEERERLIHWVFGRERLARQLTRDG